MLILLLVHPPHQKLRQPPGDLRPLRLLLRQKHLHIRIPPPQISHQRPIAKNHLRAHTPRQRRPCIRSRWPPQQRTIRISRISSRQLQYLGLLRIRLHPQRAQQIHRRRHGKLCSPQLRREVPTPNLPALLQRLHHIVDSRKTTQQILRMSRLPKHHAIPSQQLLRNRMTPNRPRTLRSKCRPLQGPPPLRCWRSRPSRPKPCLLMHPPRRLPRAVRPLAISSKGSHPIIRQQSFPNQPPQRLQRLSRIPSANPIMHILKERSSPRP